MSLLYTSVYLFLLLSILRSLVTEGSPDVAGLNSHINQLEQTVADIQAKSQVQEQKYSAVLSNVLAKLTSVTDDLDYLRLEHNATLVQLDKLQKEHNATMQTLQNLQNDHNNTDELGAIHDQLLLTQKNLTSAIHELEVKFVTKNESVNLQLDVTTLKRNMMNLQQSFGNISGTSVPEIFFEIIATGTNNFQSGMENHKPLKFDKVLLNEGNGYDKDTGVFQAPASGVYLVWAHVMIDASATDISIRLQRDGKQVIEGFPSRNSKDSVIINFIMEVEKDDKVWFSCESLNNGQKCSDWSTYGRNVSYYGGMLLRNK